MSTDVTAIIAGVAACLAAAPYLARLTLSVPDRERTAWWRGGDASRRRVLVLAAVGAVLGALAGAAAGWSALLPAFVALALAGAALIVIDYEHHRLPNRLVFALAAAAAVLLALAALVRGDWHAYLRGMLAWLVVFAVLYLLMLISPRSFGFGDVKLGGVLGAYLGWFGWGYVYYGIFAGFLLGALLSIALLATRRASLKSHIAFGPMLVVGSLVVLAFEISPSLVN